MKSIGYFEQSDQDVTEEGRVKLRLAGREVATSLAPNPWNRDELDAPRMSYLYVCSSPGWRVSGPVKCMNFPRSRIKMKILTPLALVMPVGQGWTEWNLSPARVRSFPPLNTSHAYLPASVLLPTFTRNALPVMFTLAHGGPPSLKDCVLFKALSQEEAQSTIYSYQDKLNPNLIKPI